MNSFKRIFALFLAFGLLFGLAFIPSSIAAKPAGEFGADEILVKFKPGTAEKEKANLRQFHTASFSSKIEKLDVEVLKIPAGSVPEKVSAFKKNRLVEYAEPNYVAYAFAVTNDPSLPSQWGMFKIEAANTSGSAWDVTSSTPAIRIAILDTGIEEAHEDISGKVALSRNFTTSNTVQDKNGHGTHVAGIAAAKTNNALGVAGVGYNSSLMNGKVLSDNGSGSYSWVANGIIWAADNGAHVINMSLGGSSASVTLENAVNYAWSKGAVVVAAAGNSGSSSPSYPAYYAKVIAVAATDQNDLKASWSNFGSWVDVAAPGVSSYSTYKGNSYASL